MLNVGEVAKQLEQDGIVLLPGYVTGQPLAGMQQAMKARLMALRANNVDGYDKTERFRDMVEDVLLLDQGFVDLAVDARICDVVRSYVGVHFQMVEAKAWRSLPTTKDFHGWHGDAWYDQKKVTGEIPRELKLAFYLTDVRTGGLAYLRGSHRMKAPQLLGPDAVPPDSPEITHVVGPAGTVALFDTSGVHRQSMPVLERRHAAFYCYHDPSVPLQAEDLAYNRYHPLLLNAAFLGGLSGEQQRVLGFGDQRNFVPAFSRKAAHPFVHRLFSWALGASLWFDEWAEPLRRRLNRKS